MTSFLDRLLGRQPAPTRKAVTGGVWLSSLNSGPLLSSMHDTWHRRAAAYLTAYKVGWFYKAGSRISGDFANLPWTLAYEDAEGDNEDDIVAAPGNVPFERLDPLEQFLRLSERPNPHQSGRAFKQQQMIRLDFTGRAIIYVETATAGLPTALYGINPARMYQSRNASGELVGWVMDPDAPSGGTPFSVDEIIAVEYPGADIDPQGVVEAVYQHAQLSPMIPQHTADMLATGGRLAGMAWPKERSLSEDEFADAQRAWRSVTSDPNAARRLLLFPEPMEYQSGAATPEQIGLPELAALSRDEILSTFPIHPYMVGVPLAAGLNSGESLRYVRAEYWEGTMHPRTEVWEDTLQQALVPRYEEAVGRPLDFDIDEPDLDDAESLTAKAEAYKSLVAIGFDPKETVSAVGLDDIKWLGLPDLMDPAKQAEAARAATEALANQPKEDEEPQPKPPTGQAKVKSRREDVVGTELPGFKATMRTFLAEQAERIAADLERTLGPLTKSERKAAPEWWDKEREDRLLREALRGLYVILARRALSTVAEEVGRIVFPDRIGRVADAMLDTAGKRITGINETTRKAVAEQVSEGVRRGYSIQQIVNGTAEDFRGVRGVPVFDEARAELIARTETMLAYNESAIRGYQEFGIEQLEAIDGDYDPECEERNGQVFSIEDALAVEEHPNGTLDWAPISGDKAIHRDDRMYELAMKAIDAMSARPEPQAPTFVFGTDQVVKALQPQDVHVDAPDLDPVIAELKALGETIAATPAPIIRMPEVKVNVDEVRVTRMPDRVHQVVRDQTGKPTGSVETDA